jgi:hypothetical protein
MTHYIRKRDGSRYTTDLQVVRRPGFDHWGDCYRLSPIWEGRTHYKTVTAFNREFEPISQ